MPGSAPTTGLIARYRADTNVTGTSQVSDWGDMSGNSHNLTQGTAGNRPALVSSSINGQPVIRFTRANSHFLARASSPTISQPYTMAIVLQGSTHPGAQEWVASTASAGQFSGILMSSDAKVSVYADATVIKGGAFNTNAHCHIFHAFSSFSKLYSDNTQVASGTPGGTGIGGIRIGTQSAGSEFWNGDVAELLLYDHLLDSTDMTAMAQYVFDRYAITQAGIGSAAAVLAVHHRKQQGIQ